jgi:hypothetical protein
MDEFPVEDEQREAAVAHLASEHARGALSVDELARRTADARAARTVAELLAATADPAVSELPEPATNHNRVALLAGILLAVVVGLLVLSKVL